MSTPFLRNLPHYVRMASRMNPALFTAKAMSRLGLGSMAAVQRTALTADAQMMDPGRLARLWSMLDDATRSCTGNPIELEGQRVLEVGCGPVGGFAPMAIHKGAAGYEGFDPEWNPEIFRHARIRHDYLRPVLQSLRPDAGKNDIDLLLRRFDDLCRFSSDGIECRTGDPVDLIVSLSCLEHIGDMDGALRAMAGASHSRTRHVHLVNFSNHRSKARPFDALYTLEPQDYVQRYGPHINLLRPSQIEALFEDAGLPCSIHPVSVMPEALEGMALHRAWTDRFDVEELAVRTALVVV